MLGGMKGIFRGVLLLLLAAALRADDWPQWLGPQRDGIWRETGILQKFPEGGPRLRWRIPAGGGYSGPAVANGRVYLTDRQLAPTASNPADPFARGLIPGTERVLCLDEKTGKILWEHTYDCPYTISYPAGPRATPLVDDDCVYTLGAEGRLFCFSAADGKILWSKDFKKEFSIPAPMWGFAAHPLVDGSKLICIAGGEGSTAVAFDKKTGRELWRALSAKEPGYCPPVIFEINGKRQLIVWHPEAVSGLNPETGAVYWSHPWKINHGLAISTPRLSGSRLYLTAFYNGSLMLDLASGQPVTLWQSKKVSEKDTSALHSIMSTPFWDGSHIYGVCSYGQLRCLTDDSGERVWETLQATTGKAEGRWANAFLVRQGDRYFISNEKGELILAELSPAGYTEISRARLQEPTLIAAGRPVVWSHPAFANRSIYLRNDKELAVFSLAENP